jgi:hypothetical protein
LFNIILLNQLDRLNFLHLPHFYGIWVDLFGCKVFACVKVRSFSTENFLNKWFSFAHS